MRAAPVLSSLSAVVATLAVAAGPADAGPRKRKPAPRPDLAAAVATGDAVVQCKAAIAAARGGDHARASFVLPACDQAEATAPELAAGARAARIAVARTAERQDWSPIEIVVRPAGSQATLAIDAFPGLPVREGRHLLPAGRYRVLAHGAQGDAGYELSLSEGARALVLIDLPVAAPPATAGVLDFTEGEPGAPVAGPPPKINHGSLLPDRYRRGLGKTPTRP